jgi:hypothetical protein
LEDFNESLRIFETIRESPQSVPEGIDSVPGVGDGYDPAAFIQQSLSDVFSGISESSGYRMYLFFIHGSISAEKVMNKSGHHFRCNNIQTALRPEYDQFCCEQPGMEYQSNRFA